MNRNSPRRPVEKWWVFLKIQVNVPSIDMESRLHNYFLDYNSLTKNKKYAGYICDAPLNTLKILEKYHV